MLPIVFFDIKCLAHRRNWDPPAKRHSQGTFPAICEIGSCVAFMLYTKDRCRRLSIHTTDDWHLASVSCVAVISWLRLWTRVIFLGVIVVALLIVVIVAIVFVNAVDIIVVVFVLNDHGAAVVAACHVHNQRTSAGTQRVFMFCKITLHVCRMNKSTDCFARLAYSCFVCDPFYVEQQWGHIYNCSHHMQLVLARRHHVGKLSNRSVFGPMFFCLQEGTAPWRFRLQRTCARFCWAGRVQSLLISSVPWSLRRAWIDHAHPATFALNTERSLCSFNSALAQQIHLFGCL